MIFPFLAAVLVYVITYYALTWKRPAIALLLIFVAAPFQTDLSGGGGFAKFSLAEINLIMAVPLLLASKRRIRLGPVAIPIALYLMVCLISSLQSPRDTTLASMLQMLLYFYIAVAIFATLPKKPEDQFPAMWGLVCIGSFLAIAGIVTQFGFMGMNKNGIGASLSAAAIIATELWFRTSVLRVKLFLTLNLIIITAGLLLTLSRGAWLGTVLGILILCLLRGQYKTVLRLAFVLVPFLYITTTFIPAEKRSYVMGFEKTRYNIQARYKSLYFAQEQFERSPVLGVGVGLRKEYDATNIFALTLAETGVLGCLTFFSIQGILIVILFRAQRGVRRSDPLFSLLALGGALTISRLGHGMVDHYWSRGAITIAWASVGMATYALVALRLRRKALRKVAFQELLVQRRQIVDERRSQRNKVLPTSGVVS